MHSYEVWSRKDGRGVDLISDRVPFGKLSHDGPSAVVDAINERIEPQPVTRRSEGARSGVSCSDEKQAV